MAMKGHRTIRWKETQGQRVTQHWVNVGVFRIQYFSIRGQRVQICTFLHQLKQRRPPMTNPLVACRTPPSRQFLHVETKAIQIGMQHCSLTRCKMQTPLHKFVQDMRNHRRNVQTVQQAKRLKQNSSGLVLRICSILYSSARYPNGYSAELWRIVPAL